MRKLEEVKKDIAEVKADTSLTKVERVKKLLALDDELDELFNYQFQNRIKPIEEVPRKDSILSYPLNYKANLC